MNSDIENDATNYDTFNVRKSYDIPGKNLSNDDSEIPKTPPKSKIGRRLNHELMKSDEINLDNVDPNIMENDDSDTDKPNYNTFVKPKPIKGSSLRKPTVNQKSNILNSVVSASGDNVIMKPVLPPASCSLEAEKEYESLLKSENISLRKQLESSNKMVEEMKKCVVEYEKTIQELKEVQDGKFFEKNQTINNLICERDQTMQDLNTIEKAFADLQRRFEKSKEVLESLHKNEEVLRKHADDLKEELQKSETKCNSLKVMTERRIKKAADEVESVKRQNESEIARLQAFVKKSELRISSLEKQLNQKTEENHELTKICDELISTYNNCDGQSP